MEHFSLPSKRGGCRRPSCWRRCRAGAMAKWEAQARKGRFEGTSSTLSKCGRTADPYLPSPSGSWPKYPRRNNRRPTPPRCLPPRSSQSGLRAIPHMARTWFRDPGSAPRHRVLAARDYCPLGPDSGRPRERVIGCSSCSSRLQANETGCRDWRRSRLLRAPAALKIPVTGVALLAPRPIRCLVTPAPRIPRVRAGAGGDCLLGLCQP